MKLIHSTAATFMALTFILLSPSAIAGPGHDHGEAAPQVSGPVLPRFAAVSEALELVGIVNGKQLTLYLDHFADNAPVNDAQIEIDIAGSTYKAEKHADGEFKITLKDTLKPGVIAITATINAGELTDLLATELDLHEDEHTQSVRFSWKTIAIGGGVGLMVLMALGVFVRSRRQARGA